MNKQTNTSTETTDALDVQLRQYLIGFAKRDLVGLTNMKNTLRWQEEAKSVMLKRSTSFLDVLPDEIIQAIASGQINFLNEVEIVEGNFAPVEATAEPTEELLTAFAAIAKRHLLVDTLETRGSDSLDFHSVGVIGIRKALADAYSLGARSL